MPLEYKVEIPERCISSSFFSLTSSKPFNPNIAFLRPRYYEKKKKKKNIIKCTIKKQKSLHDQTNTFENDEIFIKIKDKNIVEDILNDNTETLISSLSSDIGLILASDFDDLPTHTVNFKMNIRKIISRSITNIKVKNERIVFSDLNLYCMLFIRKNINDQTNTESVVADKLIEDFKSKKISKIIKLEYNDAIFIFFPDEKIKKYLIYPE